MGSAIICSSLHGITFKISNFWYCQLFKKLKILEWKSLPGILKTNLELVTYSSTLIFNNWENLIFSDTTRKPRPGEIDGKGNQTFCVCLRHVEFEKNMLFKFSLDYHYTTVEKMTKQIENGEFLEHAVFSSNKYGTRWI